MKRSPGRLEPEKIYVHIVVAVARLRAKPVPSAMERERSRPALAAADRVPWIPDKIKQQPRPGLWDQSDKRHGKARGRALTRQEEASVNTNSSFEVPGAMRDLA